jgi:hypothetical protein
MALDVYVGPLARYYTGDWENVVDATSRGRGTVEAQRSSVSGESEEFRARVLEWRTVLVRSLGDRIAEPLDWSETGTEHFVGRPGWDGFGALVLWAAYAEHPTLKRPLSLPEAWDDDPALIRCNAESFRSRYSHLVRNVELWLPGNLGFTFEGEDVQGRRIVMGSAQALAGQLADLNAATWKVGAQEALSWSKRPPLHEAPLELQARYAFAIMSELARRAVAHRLPMKLDY